MSQREIQRLECMLEAMRSTIEQRQGEMQVLRKELHKERAEGRQLRQMPLPHVTPPLSDPHYTSLLEQRINEQGEQLVYLHQVLAQRNLLIAYTQDNCLTLTHKLTCLQQQCDYFKVQLQNEKKLNSMVQIEINALRMGLNESTKEKQTIQNEVRYLYEENKRLRVSHEERLREVIEGIRSIIGGITESNVDGHGDRMGQMSELLGNVERELNERNVEMEKLLRCAAGGEIAVYRHTIVELRREIKEKSRVVKEVLLRMQETEEVMRDFQRGQVMYEEKLQMLEQLKDMFEQNNEIIIKAEGEKRAMKRQIQEYQLAIGMSEEKLLVLLQENQCCHQFLFSLHGEKYKKMIQRDIDAARYRREVREKNLQWATISELFSMNNKLMAKIQNKTISK